MSSIAIESSSLLAFSDDSDFADVASVVDGTALSFEKCSEVGLLSRISTVADTTSSVSTNPTHFLLSAESMTGTLEILSSHNTFVKLRPNYKSFITYHHCSVQRIITFNCNRRAIFHL